VKYSFFEEACGGGKGGVSGEDSSVTELYVCLYTSSSGETPEHAEEQQY
jgi:hypothetical protein